MKVWHCSKQILVVHIFNRGFFLLSLVDQRNSAFVPAISELLWSCRNHLLMILAFFVSVPRHFFFPNNLRFGPHQRHSSPKNFGNTISVVDIVIVRFIKYTPKTHISYVCKTPPVLCNRYINVQCTIKL